MIQEQPFPCVSCSTMALQQAQLLLNMSSLEQVNFGVQQNNTEAFAVALCHLAELHAEQVTHLIRSRPSAFCPTPAHPLVRWPGIEAKVINMDQVFLTAPWLQHVCLLLLQGLYCAVSDILQHLKEQFPPHSQHAKVRSLNPTVIFRTDISNWRRWEKVLRLASKL